MIDDFDRFPNSELPFQIPSPEASQVIMTPPTPNGPTGHEDKTPSISGDEEQRAKLANLVEVFPIDTVLPITNVLSACKGDEAEAASCLSSGEVPPKFSVQIATVRKIAPQVTNEQACNALSVCQGNREKAAEKLRRILRLMSSVKNEASQFPSTSTATTTTHINGVIQSFVYNSNKTHTTSHGTSKLSVEPRSRNTTVDLTQSSDDDDAPDKIKRIREVLPGADPIVCEHLLDVCDGNIDRVITMMLEDPTTHKFMGARKSRTGASKKTSDTTPKVVRVKKQQTKLPRRKESEDQTVEEKIRALRTIFPEVSSFDCNAALEMCDGDSQLAFERLVRDSTLRISPRPSLTSKHKPRAMPSTPVSSCETPTTVEAGLSTYSPLDRDNEMAVFFASSSFPLSSLPNKSTEASVVDEPMMNDDELKDALMKDNSGDHDSRNISEAEDDGVSEKAPSKRPIISEGKGRASRRDSHDKGSGISGLRFPSTESKGLMGLRRSGEHLVQREPKRARLFNDFDGTSKALDAKEDSNIKDGIAEVDGDDYLTPAGRKLKKLYPHGTTIILLLGENRVHRDNIPADVLSKNFHLLKLYMSDINSRDAGPSSMKRSFKDIAPGAFDTLVLFQLQGKLTLPPSKPEERINFMLDIVQAGIKLLVVGLGSLTGRVVKEMRSILIADRLSLMGSHIRRAYGMGKDGEPIQELFAIAAVRRFLEYTDEGDSDFEDDEDEGMTAAQQASYSGSRFAFHFELKRNQAFEAEVWRYTSRCLQQRRRKVLRPQRGATSEISVPMLTDPLTGKEFEL